MCIAYIIINYYYYYRVVFQQMVWATAVTTARARVWLVAYICWEVVRRRRDLLIWKYCQNGRAFGIVVVFTYARVRTLGPEKNRQRSAGITTQTFTLSFDYQCNF